MAQFACFIYFFKMTVKAVLKRRPNVFLVSAEICRAPAGNYREAFISVFNSAGHRGCLCFSGTVGAAQGLLCDC